MAAYPEAYAIGDEADRLPLPGVEHAPLRLEERRRRPGAGVVPLVPVVNLRKSMPAPIPSRLKAPMAPF